MKFPCRSQAARCLCLTVLPYVFGAQAAQALTLADLMERARAGEPTYLGARAAVAGAQAREDQAFGALLPQVSANASTHTNDRDYATRNGILPAFIVTAPLLATPFLPAKKAKDDELSPQRLAEITGLKIPMDKGKGKEER